MNMYIVVLALIIADYITGMVKAFKEKAYKSSVARLGLRHKCEELAAICFGAAIDWVVNVSGLPLPVNVGGLIIGYISLMEIGSIAENIGVILPKTLDEYIPEGDEYKGGGKDGEH